MYEDPHPECYINIIQKFFNSNYIVDNSTFHPRSVLLGKVTQTVDETLSYLQYIYRGDISNLYLKKYTIRIHVFGT